MNKEISPHSSAVIGLPCFAQSVMYCTGEKQTTKSGLQPSLAAASIAASAMRVNASP